MSTITKYTLEAFKPIYKKWFEALTNHAKETIIDESGFTDKEWESIVSNEIIGNYHKELLKTNSAKGNLVETLDNLIMESIPKLKEIIAIGEFQEVTDAIKVAMKLRADLQDKEVSNAPTAPAVVINLTKPMSKEELDSLAKGKNDQTTEL